MVLDLAAGRFHVTGAPRPALSSSELAGRLDAAGRITELTAEADFKAPQPTFPFGAHLAVVEVDTETGAVAGHILVPGSDRAAVVRAGRDGDADTGQPAGREGDRRVGDDRHHARGSQRGARRARALRGRHVDTPVNGETVWRALDAARNRG
jgi:Molybdopterin-binding domain of aldehyde dehydrogenase